MAVARRGGRARLKASDSKSDRGPEGPSGVQILSPPPIYLMSGGANRRSSPTPLTGVLASVVRGGVTERPKVRHWKCRAWVIPVPRVQIPPPPPFIDVGGSERRSSPTPPTARSDA